MKCACFANLAAGLKIVFQVQHHFYSHLRHIFNPEKNQSFGKWAPRACQMRRWIDRPMWTRSSGQAEAYVGGGVDCFSATINRGRMQRERRGSNRAFVIARIDEPHCFRPKTQKWQGRHKGDEKSRNCMSIYCAVRSVEQCVAHVAC